MHAAIFYCNMHIVTCNTGAICILQRNMDSFLLNQKGLESMSILHKKLCNMHIARRNMHIAIKNRSMHIAIKKMETSSPNEQTWSNTFQGTLGGRCKECPIPNTPQWRLLLNFNLCCRHRHHQAGRCPRAVTALLPPPPSPSF